MDDKRVTLVGILIAALILAGFLWNKRIDEFRKARVEANAREAFRAALHESRVKAHAARRAKNLEQAKIYEAKGAKLATQRPDSAK